MAAFSTTVSERVGRALVDALTVEQPDLLDEHDAERIRHGDLTVGEWFVLSESIGRPPASFL